MQNLSGLQLQILDLQSNRIRSSSGLESLSSLEELYLAYNGITQLSGLTELHQLNTLDLTHNYLTDTTGMEGLQSLEYLWLSQNKISSFEALSTLSELSSRFKVLDTVYLEHTPLYDLPNYREECLSRLPSVKQLDSYAVRK